MKQQMVGAADDGARSGHRGRYPQVLTTDLKVEAILYTSSRDPGKMGASALYRRYGGRGGRVPEVDSAALSPAPTCSGSDVQGPNTELP